MISFRKILLLQYNRYAACLFLFAAAVTITVGCNRGAETNHAMFRAAVAKSESTPWVAGLQEEIKIKYLNSVLLSSENRDAEDAVYVLNWQRSIYWRKSLYDSAILYSDSCIHLLMPHLQEEKYAAIYLLQLFIKGDIYASRLSYNEAIHNYTLAKLFMSSHKTDSLLLYKYYHSMASILFAQHKYLQAIDFFREMSKMPPSVFEYPSNAFGDVAGNINNIGECYAKAGLPDSALYYYNAALDYLAKNEKTYAPNKPEIAGLSRAVVYGDMAAVLQAQKDMAGAEKMYLKSYEVFQKADDRSYSNYLITSLAGLYNETKQHAKAREMLTAFASQNDTSAITDITHSYYKLASAYYLQTNQLAASNHALQQAIFIKDSLGKRDNQFLATNISKEFENQEQRKKNEALKSDIEIKKNYLIATIVGAVLAFIIITLSWYSLKRKSRFVKKLGALNAELERKNEDLQQTLLSLQQSQLENKNIIQTVAHDLKSPVSGIRTIVYSLLRNEQSEEKKGMLRQIQSTCTDAIALINDLLHSRRSSKL
ncbi:MAG: histidine kinase dimerization/phospho-acceptor domain-containing protein [Chitinophagaceae bacterium]